MIPVLLAGAAAALFLTGCSRKTEELKSKDPSPAKAPPNPASASSSATSARPIPPSPMLAFEESSPTFSVYQNLRQTGLQDADLDRGYHQIDYSKPGPNEEFLGKGDGRLEEREVYEAALDLYDRHPDNAAYRKIVEGFTGKPLPWALDDFDPQTKFDLRIRARAQEALALLEKTLVSQKLVPGSSEYQEKLAVGLFYFAFFPESPAFIQKNRAELLDLSKELAQIGLKNFQAALFQKGGLGTGFFLEDSPREATALEALKIKKGWCTERSKILFALFKMAKLEPFFVMNKGKNVASVADVAPAFQKNGRTIRANHVYVGLRWGKKQRFFDLAIFNSRANYPHPYPERTIHLLSADRTERGTHLMNEVVLDAVERGKNDPIKLLESIAVLEEALRLDPKNTSALVNLGSAFKMSGNEEKANAAFQEVIKLEPDNVAAHFNLAINYFLANKIFLAEASFREVLRYEPKHLKANKFLGTLLVKQRKFEEAGQRFNLVLQLDPKDEEARKSLSIIEEFQATEGEKARQSPPN